MYRLPFLVVFLASSFAGCREPDVVHRYVPVAPDIALYDGVYFESMDGMKTYKEIVIIPKTLNSKVPIVFPDEVEVNSPDLTLELLKLHDVKVQVNGDDGMGNYRLRAIGIGLVVSSHRPRRIALDSDNSRPGPFAIELRGKKIVVPIKRTELEEILGKPDEIKLKTYPGEP